MSGVGNYVCKDLLPENIYGHTKKVELIRFSLDRIRTTKGKGLRVLDIGCGSGYAVTRFLANSDDEVVGIDLHLPSIEFARQRYAGTKTEFHEKNAEELDDSWGKFDVIVMADVLEHVDNPEKILLQAKRLLNSEGTILLSIPNGCGCFEIESAIRSVPYIGQIILILTKIMARICRFFFKRTDLLPDDIEEIPYNSDSPHIHFFSTKKFMALLEKSGLEISSWRNLSFLCGPYSGEIFPIFMNFCQWNREIADRLPPWGVSAWFFELTADAHSA